ncbi:hypothetical protein [Turicibacter sanguinis]|uniref:hypothetical protein n=1 Tax=Turicibacter sanguinis TaxID=154288 RepID=UPI0018A995BB|nr:hypothetical protein [Turicibacter sanguinis]MDB8553515.1 hypothetical protein [Turicibacter sanguinis]
MTTPPLLLKARENKKIAELAAQKQYYNSATNRIYYALYQRTLHILNGKEDIKVHKKSNSHEITIDALITKVLVDDVEKVDAAAFHLIRKMRHKADYKDQSINKVMYEFTIIPSVERVESVLKKYE